MNFIFLISLLLIMSTHPEAESSTDTTKLIYRGCANQQFPDPSEPYIQNLKSLFQTLNSQSTKSNFSKSTAGDGASAIFGLYQCRGDLSNVDCYACVSQFPVLSRKFCGSAIAARFQLLGCYMRYEVAGFRQIASTDQLFKYCKQGAVGIGTANGSSGFEENREAAFEEVEKGVTGGGGFYAARYGAALFAVGQCEGDLAAGECGDCIRVAFERVKTECGDAIEGQVYLHRCYVSYSFYANGVQEDKSSSGSKHNTQKTVAIVVGATVGTGFLIVILLFTKSVLKKKHQKQHPNYSYNYY